MAISASLHSMSTYGDKGSPWRNPRHCGTKADRIGNIREKSFQAVLNSTLSQWHAQFEALLIRYDLMGYIVGTLTCPAIRSSFFDVDWVAANHCVCQDKLLLHTILASLHAGKVLANEIAFIDSPISVDYLTLYNLNGLGSKFRKVIAPIRFRESALTFEELHDMLVGHENYMRSLDSTAHTLVATTNSTQSKSFGSSRIPSNKNGDATRRGSYDHGKPRGNYRRSSVKP
ncbi:hypothetical protein MIMGU_mgv11b022026mg [Erythranthe guttata]|uniref:Uncharacterized protein n=1 Tax=Erythranthe guttata TaxID=4155 RepID=A0A022QMJ4_ERYGU|nr:hypothetical protein MIMGU_mgv11b022026mg [Erythranthe guttata]